MILEIENKKYRHSKNKLKCFNNIIFIYNIIYKTKYIYRIIIHIIIIKWNLQ